MGHEHDHSDCNGHEHNHGMHIHPVTKNLAVAFALNLVFSIVEFAGGIWTSSIAILSDAVHDLGDTTAIGFALFLERYSRKGRDKLFSYGYGRFSALSAFFTATVLAVGSILIGIHAIQAFFETGKVHTEGMIYLAIAGVVFNGLAAVSLKGGQSLNQKAVLYHLLEDLFGWIVVLIGAVLLHFTGLSWIDPLLALLISLFILYRVAGLIRNVAKIFLQSVPAGVNMEQIEADVQSIEGVCDVHDLHAWSLDGQFHVMSLHVSVESGYSIEELEDLKEKINRYLQSVNINHSTIQFDLTEVPCELADC